MQTEVDIVVIILSKQQLEIIGMKQRLDVQSWGVVEGVAWRLTAADEDLVGSVFISKLRSVALSRFLNNN